MPHKKSVHTDTDSFNEKVKELEDKFLRTLAESENSRKRAEKEKEDAIKYCIGSFAKDVLTIRDNLKLALSNCGEQSPQITDGLKITISEMDKILLKHNIKMIEALGSKFDPNLHQAMFETQDCDADSGIVIEVVQDGFMINDRLLRPSLVGISKK